MIECCGERTIWLLINVRNRAKSAVNEIPDKAGVVNSRRGRLYRRKAVTGKATDTSRDHIPLGQRLIHTPHTGPHFRSLGTASHAARSSPHVPF